MFIPQVNPRSTETVLGVHDFPPYEHTLCCFFPFIFHQFIYLLYSYMSKSSSMKSSLFLFSKILFPIGILKTVFIFSSFKDPLAVTHTASYKPAAGWIHTSWCEPINKLCSGKLGVERGVCVSLLIRLKFVCLCGFMCLCICECVFVCVGVRKISHLREERRTGPAECLCLCLRF